MNHSANVIELRNIHERGFSAQKRIKSDVRSSLHVSTTEDLIRIGMEGPELVAFDPTPVVDKWLNSGQRSRRPHLVYKTWPEELLSVYDLGSLDFD